MLKVIPLGGLGEIGLNMMVFECNDVILIVDAGIMFPENYMLGIDRVIPNISYIRENKSKVKAIIITHAHEDHIGALPYLLKEINPTIYCTSFTKKVIANKLKEFGLGSKACLKTITLSQTLTIEPFNIEFIRVSHSTPDSVALAIHTLEGTIIHTGDFRINHTAYKNNNTDIVKFAKFGANKVLALFSDSTNAEREGYTISEQNVAKNLDRYIESAKSRVVVAIFASNIFRIQQIIDIAVKNKRKVIFHGKSMEQMIEAAIELDYIKYPEDSVIDIKQAHKHKDSTILIITTGSQGEPMSALSRMASGMHKHINIRKGDLIVMSSRYIPGNEKAIANIINKFYKKGACVVYSKIAQIHASGHAHQEELKLMIKLTQPKYFIPIHGAYSQLVMHSNIAKELGIKEENVLIANNGDLIEFSDKKASIKIDNVQTSKILVDGKGIGDVGRSVLKQRQELSEGGLVVVSIIFDYESDIVLHGPQLISKGFVFDPDTGYLIDDAQCVILEILEDMDIRTNGLKIEELEKRLRTVLRQYFNFTINRKPLIVPVIIQV